MSPSTVSLSSLRQLSIITTKALLSPREAAREVIALGLPPGILLKLMDYALVTERDVESFDQEGKSYLLQSKSLGRLWLAPSWKRRALLPAAPRFSPKALRALARGLVEEAAA